MECLVPPDQEANTVDPLLVERGVVAEGLGSTLQAWGILGMVDVGVATNSNYPKKWMVVENPFTMDDFRVPLFQVISKKIYIYIC